MNKIRSSPKLSLYLCIAIIVICMILIIQFSGFRYEHEKFKQFMVSLLVIILSRYLLWEHIEFAVKSLYAAKYRKELAETFEIPFSEEELQQKISQFSPLEYLKIRLENLKTELYLTPRHKDENLNVEYQLLTRDLWLFGKYFLLVLIIIVYSRNSYGYFNTKIMKTVFIENRLNNFGLRQLKTLYDLYDFLNSTLAHSLIEGIDYNGQRLREPGWMDLEMAKLLGVVRLRQLRLKDKTGGMTSLHFDDQSYLPEWRHFNRTLYYMDKFWRTYYPWLSKSYEGFASWLLSFTHIGSLYTYPESNSYVVLLARDRKNNEKIIQFLKDHNWLDSLTATVIIDFTLYHADGNMFTVVSILVEQTPFGGVVWQLDLQSVVLLTNLDQLSGWWWFLLVFYLLQLIEFCKSMAMKYWFTTGYFQSPWNRVDVALVLLNVVICILLAIREYYVRHVVVTLGSAHKLDFIDFRVANLFDYVVTVAMGFLIALTTIRLWKILQFSAVFRLFTRTLHKAAGDLLATALCIYLLMFAIGFASQIINGSQTEVFSRFLKSLTSVMSFSFGFNSHTDPDDLSHGGNILSFILYLVLMFVVAIFLINMFITLICDHFASAREERDNQPKDQLGYGEFLWVEYGIGIKEKLLSYLPRRFHRRRHLTVSENIQQKLDKLDEKYHDSTIILPDLDDNKYETEMMRADHVQKTISILKLQMELLQRQIALVSLEWDSDEDDDNGTGVEDKSK